MATGSSAGWVGSNYRWRSDLRHRNGGLYFSTSTGGEPKRQDDKQCGKHPEARFQTAVHFPAPYLNAG